MYTIYFIVNRETQFAYVGQSLNVQNRIRHHKWSLKNNKHHCEHLQRAWNKYSEHQFDFFIIADNLSCDEANDYEQKYISWFKELNLSYNPFWRHYGRGNVSQETRKKLSQRNLEKGIKPPSRLGCKQPPMTEEQKEARRGPRLHLRKFHGCPVCGEAREEVLRDNNTLHYYKTTCGKSECLKTRRSFPKSEKQKEMLRQYRIGTTLSKEHKDKISNTLKGITPQNFKTMQASRWRSFSLISPSGQIIEGTNVSEFARNNNLNGQVLNRLINGKISKYRGWTLNQ